MEKWELIKMDEKLLAPLAYCEWDDGMKCDHSKRYMVVNSTGEEYEINSFDTLAEAKKDIAETIEDDSGWSLYGLYDLVACAEVKVSTSVQVDEV